MKKNTIAKTRNVKARSQRAKEGIRKMAGAQRLTIGLDLGDRSSRILLDPLPSLRNLRRRLLSLVRLLHRYYGAVRLLDTVPAGRLASAFSRRTGPLLASSRSRGLPVLVHVVSQRARGLRLRRADPRLALLSTPVENSPFRRSKIPHPRSFRPVPEAAFPIAPFPSS